MITPDILIYLFLLSGAVLSAVTKKLTIPAAITGGLVGLLVYKGGGYAGLGMLTLFFVLGSIATNWQIGKKQKIGIAGQHKGRRTAGQVLANGGVAALLGGLHWFHIADFLPLQIMMAGSLASATADTLSSELGSVYGRRFYDIMSLKPVPAGPDGVVSAEGTLIGACGAGLIAWVYALGHGFSIAAFMIIVAGILGNFADSILGATLERWGAVGNNMVNFLNTAIAAMLCGIWFGH
jgi:uncharacterized protein (TIGR00297 family)